MGKIALTIILLHLTVIGFGAYEHFSGHLAYDPLFFGAFLHVSPIMVIFNLISLLGSDYHGRFSALMGVGILLALLKYTPLCIAIRQDGLIGVNIASALLDAAYLAASGYYLAQLNLI